MQKQIICFFFLSSLLFFACKSTEKKAKTDTTTTTPSKPTTTTTTTTAKPPTTTKPTPAPPKVPTTREIILSKIYTPKYLNGTATITTDGGSLPSVSMSAQFNVQKDSGIVMSMSKFGFEVGRVLLKPDSVYIVNRINNSYYVRDYKYVEKQLQFPLTFQDIQSFLMGTPSFVGTLKQEKVVTDAQYHRISGNKKQVKMEFLFDKSTIFLKNLAARDTTKQDQTMNIKYDAYKQLNNKSDFAYTRNIQLKSPSTGNATVDIQFEQVEADVPKPLRFDVPTRYKRN
jgi:Domain of unknown function (DUF4292)